MVLMSAYYRIYRGQYSTYIVLIFIKNFIEFNKFYLFDQIHTEEYIKFIYETISHIV